MSGNTSYLSGRPLHEWKEFYTAPSAVKLIELALLNNSDLHLAILNVQRVQSQYLISRAALVPHLDVLVGESRQRPDTSGDVATAGIGITSYELDLFGRVRSLKQVALADYLSSMVACDAAYISLISTVAAAELNYKAYVQALALSKSMYFDQQHIRQLLKNRLAEQTATIEDLYRQDAILADIANTTASLEQQRIRDRTALLLFLGVDELPADMDNPATAGNQASSAQ
ncbi:MAG: TolC family protein [Lautropia sp.]|nr:TolC family protein [Lautropia sp.]